VSGVIFFEGPGVELWKEAPISELKELSLKVSDLDGLEGLVEKEFSLGKKEKYASLGRRVFGDYDNALEDHEKEIMRLLGKDQEDFWQK